MNDWQAEQNEIRGRIQYLFLFLLMGYFVMGVGTIWWGTWGGNEILEREDNPRTVEAELRIQRGRIVDALGIVLAENGGTPERQTRIYPEPKAASAVGYYSLRYGTSGVEAALDSVLRGDLEDEQDVWAQELLHTPQVGEDVRLSLDIVVQKQLQDAMGDNVGAAVLLFLPRGREDNIAQVRAMVSAPSYDSNVLNDEFDMLAESEDAPLLNRVTQAQYQPGEVLLPFLWASALEQGIVSADIAMEERLLELSKVMDADGLTAVWEDWGFLSAPNFVLPVAEPNPEFNDIDDMEKALSGEGSLLITPLQVASAATALVHDGLLPQLNLVTAVGYEDTWRNYTDQFTLTTPRFISPNVQELAVESFFQPIEINSNVETPLVYMASVPSGESRYTHWMIAWPSSVYMLVVVVENEQANLTSLDRYHDFLYDIQMQSE